MATLAALSLTGTAMALWYYSTTASTSKRKNSNEPASSIIDTHLSLNRAPSSFFEDLYFFVEGLRFFYGETLFKWKTADLLFGLYYLCQANGPMSTAQLGDVGSAGTVFGLEAVAAVNTAKAAALYGEIDRTDLKEQLKHMEAYCSVLSRRVSRQCNNA